MKIGLIRGSVIKNKDSEIEKAGFIFNRNLWPVKIIAVCFRVENWIETFWSFGLAPVDE